VVDCVAAKYPGGISDSPLTVVNFSKSREITEQRLTAPAAVFAATTHAASQMMRLQPIYKFSFVCSAHVPNTLVTARAARRSPDNSREISLTPCRT
jgi:hypothetical protein